MKAAGALLVGMLASNQKAKTLRCLDSLAASGRRAFDVFLVDNASPERIGEAARAYPCVTVSVQARNTGCAGGRNLILEHFQRAGDWEALLFLDNDAVVPAEALETLLASAGELRRKGVRLCGLGPHVAYYDRPDTLWCAGGALIDWPRCWFRDFGQGLPAHAAFPEPRQLDTLTGGFMFVTREAALAAGRFVEDYFIYVEDTDWCWGLKQSGYELWSAPRARFLHDASSSVGARTARFHYLRTRNRLWFFQAQAPASRRTVVRTVWRDVWQNTVRMELASGQARAAWGAIRGLLSGLRVPRAILERGRHDGARKGIGS